MELDSVIHALNYLKKDNLHDNKILLFTDSQYVTGLPSRKEKLLKAGFKTKSGNTLPNADLLQQLFLLFDEMFITITKVKSHQKNSEHERLNSEADKICRKLVRDLAEKD
jgi:ribonuclease HI